MKRFIVVIAMLTVFLFGCASQLKYTPPTISKPEVLPAYVPPDDPTAKLEPPKPFFLKRDPSDPQKWVVCEKPEGIVLAYFPVEHDKIVLRLQYLKEMNKLLVDLVNVHIQISNVKSELITDHMLAKEVYKEMYVDVYNQYQNERLQGNVEKAGLLLVILGQLAVLLMAL
jgi:hypothetical protein